MEKVKEKILAHKTYIKIVFDAYYASLAYSDAKFWLVKYAELVQISKGTSFENEFRKGYENQLDELVCAKDEYDKYYENMNKVIRWFMDKLSEQKV